MTTYHPDPTDKPIAGHLKPRCVNCHGAFYDHDNGECKMVVEIVVEELTEKGFEEVEFWFAKWNKDIDVPITLKKYDVEGELAEFDATGATYEQVKAFCDDLFEATGWASMAFDLNTDATVYESEGY